MRPLGVSLKATNLTQLGQLLNMRGIVVHNFDSQGNILSMSFTPKENLLKIDCIRRGSYNKRKHTYAQGNKRVLAALKGWRRGRKKRIDTPPKRKYVRKAIQQV